MISCLTATKLLGNKFRKCDKMIGSQFIKYFVRFILGFFLLVICSYVAFIHIFDPMITKSNYEQSITNVKAEYGDKVSIFNENIIIIGDINKNKGRTVLFHGWSMQNPLVFKGIIDKSLTLDETVIIPLFQQSLIFPKNMLVDTLESLKLLFKSIDASSNLKIIGHSAGATLAHNIFAISDIFDSAQDIFLVTPGDGSDKNGNTPIKSIIIKTEPLSSDKENVAANIKIITVDKDQIASFHTAEKIENALQKKYTNFERIDILSDRFPDSCVGHFGIMNGGKEKYLYTFTKMVINQSKACENIFKTDSFDNYLQDLIFLPPK